MTPNTPTAPTHGASQAAGLQRRGAAEDPMEPMSLQALFAALLAHSGDGAGEGVQAGPAEGAAGNGLPPGLPSGPSSGGSPDAGPALESARAPDSGSMWAADGAPGDPSDAAAALAALLQMDDTASDVRAWAEGGGVPDGAAAGTGDGPRAPGPAPGAVMALLQAQSASASGADADPLASVATTAAGLASGDASVTAPEAGVRAATRDEARGPASLPPALAMALATIARADAAAVGEAGGADAPRISMGSLPAAPSLPAGQPPAVPAQPPPAGVPPGVEQFTYIQPQPAVAPTASTALQQALRDALAQAGGATTDGRASIDTAHGASPIAMAAVPSPAAGVERAAPVWTVSTPLHHAQQWADEVGDRIRWMAGQQVQSAELNITPPDLGAIKVRISVHQDQMTISFSSPNAHVRETLEEAIPRLRDLMSGSGYDAVDVDVSHDRPGDRGDDAEQERSFAARGPGIEDAPGVIETSITRRSGGLDLYA